MLSFEDENILNQKSLARDKLFDLVRLEMLGPIETDNTELRQQSLIQKPTDLFSCGIIFPKGYTGDPEKNVDRHQNLASEQVDEVSEIDEIPENNSINSAKNKGFVEEDYVDPKDDGEIPDDIINTTEKNQATFGLSFRSQEKSELEISLYFGTYYPVSTEIEAKKQTEYKRSENLYKVSLTAEKSNGLRKIKSISEDLSLYYVARHDIDKNLYISIWVANEQEVVENSKIYQSCIFQPSISIASSQPLISIDQYNQNGVDEDTKLNALLYRKKKAFSKGHGCASNWQLDIDGNCNQIFSDFFPMYDIMPILPSETGERFSGVDFSFYGNSKIADSISCSKANNSIVSNLEILCSSYQKWIDTQRINLQKLDSIYLETATNNLSICSHALERMKKGVRQLKENTNLMKAFRLANYAMFLQQIRGKIKRDKDNNLLEIPNPEDLTTRSNRKWRPFQLAFLLMNLNGLPLGQFDEEERDLVDLIWFPTGGGKTEAYLGVAAVSICYSRLLDPKNTGTEVIMRYTLRLLTSQQFQRACLLILALEQIRLSGKFENAQITESEIPFSAGLWVGGDLTPNRLSIAKKKMEDLRNGRAKNSFAILSCPWCKKSFEENQYQGYRYERTTGITFKCPENKCDFYNRRLPIFVIDEQLYKQPPTLLLSTVDKFALVPWDEGPSAFLGKYSNRPPSLIIQDELHLISGPLGSVVGHYEDLLFEIMKKYGQPPKIIASTATIRRAKEQVNCLYNRPVQAFPPQALNYDDSFFAVEAAKRGGEKTETPVADGRRYVGVYGGALKSTLTAQRNLVAACLQFVNLFGRSLLKEKLNENGEVEYEFDSAISEKCSGLDPYGTLVWYFNSLRELGYADSLLTQDISQYIKNIRLRYKMPYPLRRRGVNKKELTGRSQESEIFEILELLDEPWHPHPHCRAVDVLLSTSMISVGVDVDRLGLMVINGQPKNTSEYIQASSRVGRQAPGLVFALYNQNRSRDRSHYENFKQYHQAIYRFVEPTSVTPYSKRCRDRSLPGLIIGIARHVVDMPSPVDLSDFEQEIRIILQSYVERASEHSTSNDYGDEIEQQIQKIFNIWYRKIEEAEENNKKLDWGTIIPRGDELPLLDVFGTNIDPEAYESISLMTSMRNVDVTSTVTVV